MELQRRQCSASRARYGRPKFGVKASTGAIINAAHPTWPWLVDFAAQMPLFGHITSADGLTSTQHIHGKSRVAAKPKFAEQILHRAAEKIRADKTAARLQKAIWRGSIQSSEDSNLFGAPREVIKCRSIAPLPKHRQAYAEATDAERGITLGPFDMSPRLQGEDAHRRRCRLKARSRQRTR